MNKHINDTLLNEPKRTGNVFIYSAVQFLFAIMSNKTRRKFASGFCQLNYLIFRYYLESDLGICTTM